MTTLTLTDANFDAFLEALYSVTPLASVDLMAANPDIREQVRMGGFDVSLSVVEFEGKTWFVALGDDGFDGYDVDEFSTFLRITETEAEGREAMDELILQWKRNWDLA